jgi:hypothetical protein
MKTNSNYRCFTLDVLKVWLAYKRSCWRLNGLVWWLLWFFVWELVWIGLGLNWYDGWFDNWFGLGRVWICMIIGLTIGLDWYESLKFLLIEYFVWFGLHEYDIHFSFQVTSGHINQSAQCRITCQVQPTWGTAEAEHKNTGPGVGSLHFTYEFFPLFHSLTH